MNHKIITLFPTFIYEIIVLLKSFQCFPVFYLVTTKNLAEDSYFLGWVFGGHQAKYGKPPIFLDSGKKKGLTLMIFFYDMGIIKHWDKGLRLKGL